MTSRFGKTYSRKGSNGSSKFDEVFNKRATLCTKWGETTYKAQVSQKRPNLKAEGSEIPKKSKIEDGVSDDPFGFDSDEDTFPLPTRSMSQSKSSSPQPAESMKTAPLENFSTVLEASTTASRLADGDKIYSSKSIPAVRASRETKENADQTLGDGDLFSFKVSTAERNKRRNIEKDKVKSTTKAQKEPQNKREEKLAQWKKSSEDKERRKAGQDCGQSNHQSPCPTNNEMTQNQTLENFENSCATYRNASENDVKATCHTTNLTEHNTDNNVLLICDSECSQENLPRSYLQQTSEYGLGFHIEENKSDDSYLHFYSDPHEEDKGIKTVAFNMEVFDNLKETVCETEIDTEIDTEIETEIENETEYTAHVILRSGNCRTYCRSSKAKQSQGTFNFEKVLDGTGLTTTKTNSVLNHGPGAESKHTSYTNTSVRGTAGRTRDYTVLHPSCLSVCNVTIQDSMERSVDDLATAAPADLGEAGRLRKKAELASSKTTTRFRPGNPKSKKDVKLAFFGFDENDGGGDGEGASRTSGSSNYRIKYFGFDDLSESDDDDDEVSSERKAKKMAKKAAAARMRMSNSEGSEHSLHSQTSTNSDTLNYAEEPYMPDVSKKSVSKQPAKEGARKIFSGPKRSPTKAVYNARHWNHPDQEELPSTPGSKSQTIPSSASTKDVTSSKDDGIFKAPAPPPKVIKAVTMPIQPSQEAITTLRCRKEDKELYTVVQHVKHFNDVVEFGENQEFSDDIEYLLSGLKSSQPLNTRCLSVISLATKCAMPSFRMHLRAHGMVAMVFKTLGDAQQYQNLALCTAALMYILSRDRLNMDLDRASLDLMIRLLEMEQDPSAHQQLSEKEMSKVKEKIRKLCETVHNRHLDLENITTGHLAMETLLSLTSKRAGDWFKEELRLLGGLDHIVDKVKECADHLDIQDEEEKLFAYLWGAERCLRVLESVTVHNPENQSYLIAYKDSQLIVSSARALQHCEELIQHYNRADVKTCGDNALCSRSSNHLGKAVEDCMRAIFGVLLNLTNDNEWGSTKTGEQDNLISTVLNCVLQVPQYLPQEQRFDIRVLGLGLLINLVEYSARNRHCLVNMETSWSFDSFCAGNEDDSLRIDESVSAIRALVQLFLQRERAAQLAESQTDDCIKDAPSQQLDKSGEWQETGGEIQWVAAEKSNDSSNTKQMDAANDDKKEEEDEELDLNKALQHAGKHMEDCIVASYTALLLGCLCQDSPMNVTIVRDTLPDGDFSIMTEMLRKFLNFMNLTCAVGTTGQKSISRVIEYLEHC